MLTWGEFLSYVIVLLLGLFWGGGFGVWLSRVMVKREILAKNNESFWEIAFSVIFIILSLFIGFGLLSAVFRD